MLRGLLWSVGIVVAAALVWTAVAYQRDMERAYARLQGRSQVLASPVGDIEYSDLGAGPPVHARRPMRRARAAASRPRPGRTLHWRR